MGNLFLLGAGFDRSLVNTAPLNNELLSELIRFSNGKFGLDQLESQYHTKNIEQIITYLDLEILEGNEDSKKLRAKINELIAKYFQQFRFNEGLFKKCSWVEDFIKNVISDNDIIVSLNYSCLIDGLLDYCEVWTPRNGYTKFVNNWLTTTDDYPENPKGILLYKIHGSEHFGEVEVMYSSETYIAPLISKSIFPKSSAHTEFGEGIGKIRQYIVAPSFIKIPHVQISYLIMDAIRQAERAKNFIIIGCGMRLEDNVLWLMLTNFLKVDYKSAENKDKKLIIVDPQANSVGDRIKTHFSNLIGGFFETENFVLIQEDFRSAASKLQGVGLRQM